MLLLRFSFLYSATNRKLNQFSDRCTVAFQAAVGLSRKPIGSLVSVLYIQLKTVLGGKSRSNDRDEFQHSTDPNQQAAQINSAPFRLRKDRSHFGKVRNVLFGKSFCQKNSRKILQQIKDNCGHWQQHNTACRFPAKENNKQHCEQQSVNDGIDDIQRQLCFHIEASAI